MESNNVVYTIVACEEYHCLERENRSTTKRHLVLCETICLLRFDRWIKSAVVYGSLERSSLNITSALRKELVVWESSWVMQWNTSGERTWNLKRSSTYSGRLATSRLVLEALTGGGNYSISEECLEKRDVVKSGFYIMFRI
jgi:hypothetical protein